MKAISFWAKNHLWLTRLGIVLILYPIINISGWILGSILQVEGFQFSYLTYYFLAFITVALVAFYSSRKSNTGRYSYTRRKITDALLAFTTFCFALLTGNHFNSSFQNIAPVHASEQITTSLIKPKPGKEKKKSFKKILKDLKKKYKQSSEAGKVLLIILTILVALGAVYLLAALSCSIACGGAEALAYVVFLLGLGGIIFGVVKIIQSIVRKRRKKADPQSS